MFKKYFIEKRYKNGKIIKFRITCIIKMEQHFQGCLNDFQEMAACIIYKMTIFIKLF